MKAFTSRVLTTVSIVFIQACATNNAQKVRESRSLTATILMSPGAIYRPNGRVGIGAVYSANRTENDSINHSDASSKEFGEDSFNAKESRSREVDAFVHYYPWSTSAFFMGVGFQNKTAEYSVAVDQNVSTLEEADANLKYSSRVTKVKVPVGWSWIYENGFSVLFDLGPTISVKEQGTVSGTANNQPSTRKDLLVKDLARDSKGAFLDGIITLGYSF